MNVPRQWFLTIEGSNRERGYHFCTKVTDLHLDDAMRQKGCHVRVQSRSACGGALHIKCDIAKTYLFRYSCISQVPNHNYSRVVILEWRHESCSLFMCEGCGSSAQWIQLTLSGCHLPLLKLWTLPTMFLPPPMMPTWLASPHTKANILRLLCRSQTTVYPVQPDAARTCCNCRFHDMNVISSDFDKCAPG